MNLNPEYGIIQKMNYEKERKLKMKKCISIVLVISLMIVGAVSAGAARIGDVVNKTLYTDIVTKINGRDIQSYNVSGYTVVVAEDLRNYGFDVVWNDAERTLHITKNEANPTVTSTYVAPEVPANKVGKKASNVLYSDIKTYIDGKLVTSYNIGGRTVVYFNDLGCFGEVSYDDGTRTLSGQFSWIETLSAGVEKYILKEGDIDVKVAPLTGSGSFATAFVTIKNNTRCVITFDNVKINDTTGILIGGTVSALSTSTASIVNWPMGKPEARGDNTTGNFVVECNGEKYYIEFDVNGTSKFQKIS